ncbi:phage tail sheath family protein [Aquimarina sp. AD10]|uniref:phage tail sheath family protein n=1 Tax=Aquimarina sp. AD10 TaxID=1714849 RepID=UPI000E496B4F|nr:phage tail sheath C-terminal domain-containing protein [Aquimarina sp. AD10]AXT61404.1 phage tail sheath family protein [Aquimarina sp. AD10]RKN01402.1 phage tail sheath family protein [Aquimarina sp. AD10]
MSNYLTPDVYTEEIPLLPPSVAGVSTAVPAFIGYTEKTLKSSDDESIRPIRISTLLEYKEIFGKAQSASFVVDVENKNVIKGVKVTPPQSTLYHALDLYFKNGGGECYIISVGTYDDYSDATAKDSFLDGLKALAKEDEPTLVMLGEAAKLPADDYHEICTEALKQCNELKDRFCVFDTKKDDIDGSSFRNGIGINNLKYGAAYTPYIQTSLSYKYDDSDVIVKQLTSSEDSAFEVEYQGIRITYSGDNATSPKFRVNGGTGTTVEITISTNNLLSIKNVPDTGIDVNRILEAWALISDKKGFDIVAFDESGIVSQTSSPSSQDLIKNGQSENLKSYKEDQSALYNKIVNQLAKEKMILPPSSAIAGVYATIDRERGVWKAPANVSLNAVNGPIVKITSSDQEKLNVDTTAGKSINAIRSFVGKGTLVWGARTLAGNDNEWRYVSVRRLFNMIEESTKKASYFAVFEPNDPSTWLKVKAMIESFLYGIWQQGGLAGSTDEQAYFVNVGLGKTMTQQDVLEGRMIIEIGIAATRPAEFIILKFSHKLQEV